MEGKLANMCISFHWHLICAHIAIPLIPTQVSALCASGASLSATNSQGNTALHLAAVNGHVDAVAVLVDAGADVSAANKEGKTPGDVAKTDGVRSALEKR